MNWTELLTREIEETYAATQKLIDLVDDDKLDWKPADGSNWMTTGQLLEHIATACGGPLKGFVTGDWGLPEGVDPANMSPEQMIPPAAAMPASATKAEAKEKLAADKMLALGLITETGESDLADKDTVAPWDPSPMKLGRRLLHSVGHLNNHKTQLYYYLKLQDQPVNTWHLYGMA